VFSRRHEAARTIRQASRAGQARINGLPSGRYFVAAVDYLEVGTEKDPELLRSLSMSATRVEAVEKQTVNVAPRLIVR
ncbi:MAG TPA: hypothetical protein VJP86_13505, partial [Vicinamibacterales bacterium]|nr:hypothetical protein [Vicinamibacterales bacterium]